jgi:hypothetical protein
LFLPLWGKARMGVYMNKEKAIVYNFKNCYMNSEEIHSYREGVSMCETKEIPCRKDVHKG